MPDDAIHEGLLVDILFDSPGPHWGDLLTICGEPHADCPPTGSHCFDDVADLGFAQVDDYFGIRPRNDEGADVAVWLYPLIKGETVYHHLGPFDGVRLHYNVLRNPGRRVEMFRRAVKGFAAVDGVVRVTYVTRGIALGLPPDLDLLMQDIRAVRAYWLSQGIEVGSDDALLVD